MTAFYLVIEGAIGVGKTTLARLLQPRFGAELLLEAFEENPFLSDFYGDRQRYAFQTQMFFLLSRYRQQQEIPTRGAQPLIGDYSFGKDALFARLNLEGDELDMYERLYSVLADRIPVPDLVVYLQADPDILMARIAARDRPYEREMDPSYIAKLASAYERHFAAYSATSLLTIDTNDLNYVQDASALAFVEGKIRQALGIGSYQKPLPQIDQFAAAELREAPPRAPQAGSISPLSTFLAANEAMGRLGALLARAGEYPTRDVVVETQVALEQVVSRLGRLADAVDDGAGRPSR